MPVSVSILICTRNRAQHLSETLHSVNQLMIPEHLAPELVIVDNGSTDSTHNVLSDPPVANMPVRSIVEPKRGVARARNAALQAAPGQILLWLDDDVRVPSNWLHFMTRPILDGDTDAVAGKVVLAPHLKKSWMQPFHRTALASTESIDPEAPKNIISANMAFARTILEDVPGFDPELGPGSRVGALEDTLFSWQIRQAGYEISMVTETAVEHHFDEQRLTREGFVRSAIARGRSLSYIQYHWLHYTQENWTHRDYPYQFWRQPYIVLLKRFADWAIRRGVHWLTRGSGPINKREFWIVMNLYNLKQYLIERTHPRNYAKKGLRKIRGERSLESTGVEYSPS